MTGQAVSYIRESETPRSKRVLMLQVSIQNLKMFIFSEWRLKPTDISRSCIQVHQLTSNLCVCAAHSRMRFLQDVCGRALWRQNDITTCARFIQLFVKTSPLFYIIKIKLERSWWFYFSVLLYYINVCSTVLRSASADVKPDHLQVSWQLKL